MNYIFSTKKGLKRNKNQDDLLIVDQPNYQLFIVFDGVSSNQNSHAYIEAFKKKLKVNIKNHTEDSESCLDLLFYYTYENLLLEGLDGQSTLTALYFSKHTNCSKYLNIGDSRIYAFNNKYIEKITEDDSIAEKNILTKYLGHQNLKVDDFKLSDLDYDGNYLLCTDGFYSIMHTELKDFFETINFKYLHNIKKKLSNLQRNKNNDDSTYILIKNEI